MKPFVFLRRALIFSASSCILLTGCTGKPAGGSDFAPRLDPAYSVSASLQYGDQQSAELTLTRYGTGSWDAAFSEPDSLAGVLLTFDGNVVTASYKGLAFTVPKSAMAAKMMLSMTTEVLDSLEVPERIECKQQSDGTWESTGDSENGSYTVTFTDAGVLSEFSMPGQPLTITFSDYKPISAASPAAETTSPETTNLPPSETTAETTKESVS